MPCEFSLLLVYACCMKSLKTILQLHASVTCANRLNIKAEENYSDGNNFFYLHFLDKLISK